MNCTVFHFCETFVGILLENQIASDKWLMYMPLWNPTGELKFEFCPSEATVVWDMAATPKQGAIE